MRLHDFFETKVRLDPKCWTGYKIGNPKTKMKGGVRVNNCVPAESVEEGREFGSYYYEQLAQKVFDRDPNLTDENKILDLGYSITKDELGSRARGIFSDQDFAGDLISAYNWLKKQGVAEGTGNIGQKIKALYQKIYDQGDDSIDYMYHESPVFAQIWDEYEGDLDSIIAEVDPSELQVIANELEAYLQGPGLAEGFKNTYEVNDRVETPMGTGTIVAVSPNINVDGKIRVKLDNPSRAGEDGKHKDTFTLTTMQVKHMATTESDMSGIMHAAQHLNKSFIITADVAEGGRKKYRVRAQSERVAREKFAKHYSMAKIVDVKEED